MKKHWKLALLPALFLVCATHVGCARSTAEVALITGLGDIDDGSFNQSSWGAVKEFCEDPEHPLTYEYYRPFTTSDFARRLAIRQAVAKGAKVIILPGFTFNNVAAQAQIDYPEVKFLLLDASVTNFKAPNLCCVSYSCAYSGYLAGYATAFDYVMRHKETADPPTHYSFGYCAGTPVPTVFPFGYGFVQGLARGIAETIPPDSSNPVDWNPPLNVNFLYSGVFAHDDKTSAAMMGWYADDIKAVFSCGGKLYQSVTDGVKDYNHKHDCYNFKEGKAPIEAARWIGVDTNQYDALNDDHERKTLLTSALKDLPQTIKDALTYYLIKDDNGDAWNDIIGQGSEKTNTKFFSTADEANEYIANNPVLFAGYKTSVEQEEGTSTFRIVLKTSDPNYQYDFKEGVKNWNLELNDLFGLEDEMEKHGLDPDERLHSYVGIPINLKEGSDEVLRGFEYFTKADLEAAITHIVGEGTFEKWKVYCGDGTDIYIKDKPSSDRYILDPDRKKEGIYGYAHFMNNSDSYYVKAGDEYMPFGEMYFPGYKDLSKITITKC